MKALYPVAILMMAVLCSKAQVEIKGRVLDNYTGKPVPTASIYLNNTSSGTIADSNGVFILHTSSLYTGELIISSVGYKPLSFKLNKDSINKYFYTFKLEIKENTLRDVMVMNDAARQTYMKTFRDNFLGITEEADNCRIENLSTVYFTAGETKNSFYAYADTPLVVINKMLGYKIFFDLVEFTFDKDNNRTSFVGYSRYEEMGNKRRWIKARRQNYYGSTMHFYRSLVADDLKQQKFSVFAITHQNSNTDSSIKKAAQDSGKFAVAIPVTASVILERDTIAGKFYLHSSRKLMVTYNETPHSKYYLSSKIFVKGLNHFGFTAYLSIDNDSVEIDKQGIVFNPLQIIYDGYWTYERFANHLPYNYTPE